MKTLQQHTITHPLGAEVDLFIEVTSTGELQHRLVCKHCEVQHTFEASTEKEDAEIVRDWVFGHLHRASA